MARASALNPCSEHVSGWGPAMMSPAAGMGVGMAGQVPKSFLLEGGGLMMVRPPLVSPTMVHLWRGRHLLLGGDSACYRVFQPPTLPRAPRRKAGGRGWSSSSRYVAPPWCFSLCLSSSATKPSKGECSRGSEP